MSTSVQALPLQIDAAASALVSLASVTIGAVLRQTGVRHAVQRLGLVAILWPCVCALRSIIT